MAIFNSLGSNYSLGFVWRSLFSRSSTKNVEQVRGWLNQHYGGESTLTYKGRQALELALRKSGLPKGSKVGINGFTCYVVYQAVERAGLVPVFIDIAPGTLHFDSVQLAKAIDIKAVIVQNTLGLPADMAAIVDYCKKHQILVIEDLAHSVGAVYADGREAGTVGQLVMLSFSQDKQLDVVAGGAVIDRRSKPASQQAQSSVSVRQRCVNRMYPFWTSLIRGLYAVGVGRYLHFILKKLHLLATPMSDNVKGFQQMTKKASAMLVYRLRERETELAHRREIAAIYTKRLPINWQFPVLGEPSYLRFPIKVDKRSDLIEYLKKNHVHIGDTWYDAPIGPRRYLARTSYKTGQCPESEKLAQTIVNLPTHQHVTPGVAQAICDKIKQWQA